MPYLSHSGPRLIPGYINLVTDLIALNSVSSCVSDEATIEFDPFGIGGREGGRRLSAVFHQMAYIRQSDP
jgi:hypothetical protein